MSISTRKSRWPASNWLITLLVGVASWAALNACAPVDEETPESGEVYSEKERPSPVAPRTDHSEDPGIPSANDPEQVVGIWSCDQEKDQKIRLRVKKVTKHLDVKYEIEASKSQNNADAPWFTARIPQRPQTTITPTHSFYCGSSGSENMTFVLKIANEETRPPRPSPSPRPSSSNPFPFPFPLPHPSASTPPSPPEEPHFKGEFYFGEPNTANCELMEEIIRLKRWNFQAVPLKCKQVADESRAPQP